MILVTRPAGDISISVPTVFRSTGMIGVVDVIAGTAVVGVIGVVVMRMHEVHDEIAREASREDTRKPHAMDIAARRSTPFIRRRDGAGQGKAQGWST